MKGSLFIVFVGEGVIFLSFGHVSFVLGLGPANCRGFPFRFHNKNYQKIDGRPSAHRWLRVPSGILCSVGTQLDPAKIQSTRPRSLLLTLHKMGSYKVVTPICRVGSRLQVLVFCFKCVSKLGTRWFSFGFPLHPTDSIWDFGHGTKQ